MKRTKVQPEYLAKQVMGIIHSAMPLELELKLREHFESVKIDTPTSASTRTKGASRFGDKSTSILAANQVKVTNQHRILLTTMREHRTPMTMEEICSLSHIKLNSGSTRFAAMESQQWIASAGVRDKKYRFNITERGLERLASLEPVMEAA